MCKKSEKCLCNFKERHYRTPFFLQLSTLFGSYSITFSFICVQLIRTVLANHVLISIFELGSKVSKIVTTEIGTTKIFCGVSVATSLYFFFLGGGGGGGG